MTSAPWVVYASPSAEVQLRFFAMLCEHRGKLCERLHTGIPRLRINACIRAGPVRFCSAEARRWRKDLVWKGGSRPESGLPRRPGTSAMGATSCCSSSADSGTPCPGISSGAVAELQLSNGIVAMTSRKHNVVDKSCFVKMPDHLMLSHAKRRRSWPLFAAAMVSFVLIDARALITGTHSLPDTAAFCSEANNRRRCHFSTSTSQPPSKACRIAVLLKR